MSHSSLCMQRPWEHLQVTLFQILHTKSEEITMFGSFKKIQTVQISLADIPILFLQAKNHGRAFSISFCLPVTHK